jgi:hypothetical protein
MPSLHLQQSRSSKVEKPKAITFRMPKKTWLYYKKLAADHELTLTELLLNILNQHKNNAEKMLTGIDTVVS